MWTSRNRCRYERKGLRYPTDLTDAEWALVAPHIRAAKRGGRPRTTNMREVTNAILYVLGTGCQWRALPKDFPPRTTVFEYLDLWEWDGTLGRLHHALFLATREQADKEASPTAAIIDSQSVKGAEKGGRGSTRRAQRKEATYPGRHAGPPVERRGSSGQHPGSRRWSARPQGRAAAVPLHRADLRRRRLSRRSHGRRSTSPRPLATRNRQALRSYGRFRGSAPAMDRRTYIRMARSLPPPRQGLRKQDTFRRRLHPSCDDPPHAQTPYPANRLIRDSNFPNRL